jgi:sugar/nucleoside kinase (ribokinase family)
MRAARGATATLSSEELDLDMLDNASWLHVSAYAFLDRSSREAALAAMRRVKERGGTVSLDPASDGFLLEVGPESFFAWVADLVDVLFPNLDEGRVLTGEEDADGILRTLLVRFPMVVLKLGAQGAMGGAGNTVLRRAAYQVPSVDTTGAGDSFAAAFVISWLAERDLATALKEGNRLAAAVVQAPGARFRADLPAP